MKISQSLRDHAGAAARPAGQGWAQAYRSNSNTPNPKL